MPGVLCLSLYYPYHVCWWIWDLLMMSRIWSLHLRPHLQILLRAFTDIFIFQNISEVNLTEIYMYCVTVFMWFGIFIAEWLCFYRSGSRVAISVTNYEYVWLHAVARCFQIEALTVNSLSPCVCRFYLSLDIPHVNKCCPELLAYCVFCGAVLKINWIRKPNWLSQILWWLTPFRNK